jgi:hypothetical protein
MGNSGEFILLSLGTLGGVPSGYKSIER